MASYVNGLKMKQIAPAVIGYPSRQDGALLYGYDNTHALISC